MEMEKIFRIVLEW